VHEREHRSKVLLFGLILGAAFACSDSAPTDAGGTSNPPATPTPALRRELELTSNCFNWPAQEFSVVNHVDDNETSVTEGDQAIDFTLKDTEGVEYRLSQLLRTKPVLIVFGSFT
jgi:cytochrome oxidase Cu insertion factor (SCO1/SenC/PrrC family)